MRLLSMGTAGLIEEVVVPGSPQCGCYMALTCLKLPILRLQECIMPLWGPESTNIRKEVTTYELTRSIG